MPDYRTMYDRNFLYAFDLRTKDGKPRDVTVEIARVDAGELQSPGTTKKTHKPVVFFKGREQGPGLALNKTNGKQIAALYGNDTEKWIGRAVTLYPTTTKFGRDTVECIRIKPSIPRGAAEAAPESSLPPVEPPHADPEEGTPGERAG
jgi:hypothetical protein